MGTDFHLGLRTHERSVVYAARKVLVFNASGPKGVVMNYLSYSGASEREDFNGLGTMSSCMIMRSPAVIISSRVWRNKMSRELAAQSVTCPYAYRYHYNSPGAL